MKAAEKQPVAYLLKRYPRLSETFILNEIRALERLGTKLHVFSLMQVEETLTHPAVAEVQAPITYFPSTRPRLLFAIARAHMEMAALEPWGYLRAVALALWWSLQSRRPLSAWKNFLRSGYIARSCRRYKVRHLHAHFANVPAAVARLASAMCGVPYSFTTHAKDLYLTSRRALRRLVTPAEFVLTCTRYNVEYLRSFVRTKDLPKIHLVYHGIDVTEFQRTGKPVTTLEEGTSKDQVTPLILSVGRLVPKKGMRDLISACRLLMNRGVKFRCVIVGSGPLRSELEAQISRLGLSEVVILLGALPHDRLLPLYGRARIFALAPQITEDGDRDGIPNVLAEAMAARLPVVSTSVSGIPELVENGRTGLLVAPGDIQGLADAMDRLLCDSALRLKLAAAARCRIETGFECWETAKALTQLLPEGACA